MIDVHLGVWGILVLVLFAVSTCYTLFKFTEWVNDYINMKKRKKWKQLESFIRVIVMDEQIKQNKKVNINVDLESTKGETTIGQYHNYTGWV